jgi:hypothetical protein
VTGDLAIGGSTNLASGITINGDLAIDSGALRDLAILDALVAVSGRVRFGELEFTRGRFRLATAAGRLEAAGIEIVSREDVAVKADFAWQEDRFSGTLQIGCDPALLQRAPAAVVSAFFKPEADGKLWISTPLEGPIETLTKEVSGELLQAKQAAAK